jgi:hypothetical protein
VRGKRPAAAREIRISLPGASLTLWLIEPTAGQKKKSLHGKACGSKDDQCTPARGFAGAWLIQPTAGPKKRARKKDCGSKGDQNIPAGGFAGALVD